MTEKTALYHHRKQAALDRLGQLRVSCWPMNPKRRLILIASILRSGRFA